MSPRRSIITLAVQAMDEEASTPLTIGDVRKFVKMAEAAQLPYATPIMFTPSDAPEIAIHASAVAVEEDD